MSEPPRRRRPDSEDRGGGGVPIFPLVLAVVFIGLLIGGVFAHFFGNRTPAPVLPTPFPPVTPLPSSATPQPLSSATLTPKPKPSPKSSASPTASASSSPSPSPKASVSARPDAIIVTPPPASATSTPAKPLATPKPPSPTPTPTPVTTANPTPANATIATGPAGATAIVHAYIQALMRGNRSVAASYLSRSDPNETFIDAQTQINDISSATPNSNGSYRVTADVSASDKQEYFITFTVEPGPYGMQITDHFFIKPH